MRLEYQAFDKTGARVSNVIEAASAIEATEKLRRQELYVAQINAVGEGPAPSSSRGLRLPRSRVRKLRELAMFTRQLYSLVHSGTPLAQGLQALERQAQDVKWREMIADVRAKLEHGSPLSEAVGSHPEYFDPVYKAMIAAGESSGKLTTLLDRMATLTRKRVHVLSAVRSAMVYPVLLAVVGVGVLAAMLLFVVPRFAQLFENIGTALPPTTKLLISLSEGLRTYWWGVAAGLAAGVAGLWFYLKTPSGKRAVDTLVLNLPYMGKIVKSFTTARIARLLGLLVDSHLPIQDILRLTRGATSNCHYAALLERAESAVARGEAVSSAFRDSHLISPSVYEAMRSGEQAGQVSGLLLDLADFLDEENELTLKSLTSIIEPVMLVLMGAVVAFVVVSIFLPLFDVTSMVSGGSH